jgi:hypothetical protein
MNKHALLIGWQDGYVALDTDYDVLVDGRSVVRIHKETIRGEAQH